MVKPADDLASTASYEPKRGPSCPDDLIAAYRRLVDQSQYGWESAYRRSRLLGVGGQGMVFLASRRGADGFRLPVALKIFSPEPYSDALSYTQDMARIASVAARVAQIQHDNLLDVHNFVSYEGFRIMVMEWIDGFDIKELLTPERYRLASEKADDERWAYLSNVAFTLGPSQVRLKPGVAVQVARECLAALEALHREGIIHGDVKPANVMLKRTGAAKIVDIGAAVDMERRQRRRIFAPAYAAPEILEGKEQTPQSDLASLGYLLIEMLAGEPIFATVASYAELIDAKRALPGRLPHILPEEVTRNELLLDFCGRLIAPEPRDRFVSAEAAGLEPGGAADFLRQLIKVDLASEYGNDIRIWLELYD